MLVLLGLIFGLMLLDVLCKTMSYLVDLPQKLRGDR